MCDNRNLDTKQRGLDGLTEHVLVASIIGVCHQSDTGRQHFWTGGFDKEFAAIPK